MVGIVSYGAYIPMLRMSRDMLGQVWGKSAGKGERAIANVDEDSITMAVEAVVDALTGMDRHKIDGVYFASVTAPYKEKQSASIVKAAVDLRVSPRTPKKPPATARKATRGRLTANGRRRLSLAAKKRWAAAKRKGVHAATGRPLRQTA